MTAKSLFEADFILPNWKGAVRAALFGQSLKWRQWNDWPTRL